MLKKILLLVLVPWNQFASQCHSKIAHLIQENEQHLKEEFELSVSQDYPSVFDKVDQLEKIDLQGIDMDEILRATYIRDIEKRYKALETLGLNPSKIALLQQMGVFDLSPYHYRWLTGLFPMKTVQIRPGIRVSVPNREGYLVNAVIDHIGEEKAYVTLDFSQSKEIRPLEDIFHPLTAHKFVLYIKENGIPHVAEVLYVAVDGTVSLDIISKRQRIPIEELKLVGRASVKTGGQDFSKKLTHEEVEKLYSIFVDIKNLYRNRSYSDLFEHANNLFMDKIKRLLQEQGVFTSIFWDDNGVKSLNIEGVHPNGNRVARKYQRMLEEQGYLRATFSIVDQMSLGGEPRAFYDSSRTRIEFGMAAILQLLKGHSDLTAFHEIRHLMRNQKNKTNRRTIFDYHFNASPLLLGKDFYGRPNFISVFFAEKRPYQNYFAYDELYTHSSDLVYLAKELKSLGKTEEDYREYLLNHFKEKLSRLAFVNKNAIKLTDTVLRRPLKVSPIFLNNQIHLYIAAGFFRSIVLRAPNVADDVSLLLVQQEIKKELLSLLAFSKEMEKRIEKLQKELEFYKKNADESELFREVRALLLAVRREERVEYSAF